MASTIVAGNFAAARRLMESIRPLEDIERSGCEDLAIMPSVKQGTEWARDRESDLRFAQKSLIRLRLRLAELAASG